MLADLFFSEKCSRPKKPDARPLLQDSILLSQFGQAPAQDQILQGRPASEVVSKVEISAEDCIRPTRSYWHSLCYFLHAFLIVIHLVLLVVALSHHAERRVIITYDQAEALTTPLSVGLQAFYTLYTTLLVYITQRLTLSAIFASSRKLTHIHDMCGAWGGVGAALGALWQQTKVTSSVLSIVLVTMYFACISILHITSSTLIQIQALGGHPSTAMSVVLRTWPNASVDLGSLDWVAMAPLIPFLQSLFPESLGTYGLVNNTLYDNIGTDDFLSVTVDAMTLNANCGILTNLSIDVLGGSIWNVNSSMLGLGLISIMIPYLPLLNEIWFPPSIQCLEPICSSFILFLVSAEMVADESVHGVDHVYINGTYYQAPGGTVQNFSTPISFVACSLNTTNHTITLDSSGYPFGSGEQPANLTWSAFSPAGDQNLTSAISYAMKSANSLQSSSYCQPIMSYHELWANITIFHAYMRSVLGMSTSPCDGTPIVQYASTPTLLTRNQMESTVSQIAAEFMWLAGQLGEVGGGFDQQVLINSISGFMEQWSLNINILPVIFALGASVITLMLVVCILWRLPVMPAVVSGSGVLEIMWLGSHSQVLRDHLSIMEAASLDSLRAWALFETVLWTCPENEHERSRDIQAVAPFSNIEISTGNSRRLRLLRSEYQHPRDLSRRRLLHTMNIFHGTRSLCYISHVMLIALHVALLALLVDHPEQSVIISVDIQAMTVGLSAILQAFYTLYSALLVFLMQRLSLLKITSERQKLTTVHDMAGAWTGIGTAINILWEQRKGSSSIREIIAVTAYLAMMLVLHITSSSVLRWRYYQGPPVDANLQTNLAMPDDTVNLSQLGWSDIFPIVRLMLDAELDTMGLSNNTVYDVSPPSPLQGTLVNVTTMTAQCGLVSNLTLFYQEPEEKYQISFQNGTDTGCFIESPIWKDVIHAIVPTTKCVACPQTLFYLITTAIVVDESVHDRVALGLNWTYTTSTGNAQISTTLAYVAACSLNAQTVIGSPEVFPASNQTPTPSTSTSWSVWSPEHATNFSVGMETAFSTGITTYLPVFFQGNSFTNFTDIDNYIMTSLGLNLTYANETSMSQSSANASVTLSPWQLENVIAQTAATFLWVAGQVGESGGGFQRSTGETQVPTDPSPVWRLHANTIPIIFASIASVSSLILVMVIIGRGPTREYPPSISGTSFLECLWLEAHSELLHSRFQTVNVPRSDVLRAMGMFEICLGDIGRSSYTVEVEQPMLEMTDG